MSALRVALPGQPIRYIDLGPARGRISVNTSLGGPIEPRIVRREAPKTGTCGQTIPRTGNVCGRPAHSAIAPHRSVEMCERDRARRKASR